MYPNYELIKKKKPFNLCLRKSFGDLSPSSLPMVAMLPVLYGIYDCIIIVTVDVCTGNCVDI